jgi:hypothetical protein
MKTQYVVYPKEVGRVDLAGLAKQVRDEQAAKK